MVGYWVDQAKEKCPTFEVSCYLVTKLTGSLLADFNVTESNSGTLLQTPWETAGDKGLRTDPGS